MIAEAFNDPLVRRPPSIRIPSGRGSARIPSAPSPRAIAAIRSDSLTRSSAAPLTVVTPLGAGGGHEERRQLVDRERHQPRRCVDPLQRCRPDLDVRYRFGTAVPMVDQAQIGAHQRQQLEQPCARRIDTDPLDEERPGTCDAAGDDEECGRREVPGTTIRVACSRGGGCSVVRPPRLASSQPKSCSIRSV
jgi:hypothetical protein